MSQSGPRTLALPLPASLTPEVCLCPAQVRPMNVLGNIEPPKKPSIVLQPQTQLIQKTILPAILRPYETIQSPIN